MRPIRPLEWPSIVLMSVVMTFGPAPVAFAQLQGGEIFGTVEDDEGEFLQGATVVAEGPEHLRPVVTDERGTFRFVDLAPGFYTLEAARDGYSTVIRSGVQVDTGRTTTLAIDLRPEVDYTITVTEETPLLDVRRVERGATFTEAELREIPSGRDPWSVLRQVPGVFLDRVDVGGSDSATQAALVSGGAPAEQTVFHLDGVEITDLASGGSPFHYDFEAIEEIQVVTGASDPRLRSPGAQINLVLGRGTDELAGSARAYFSEEQFQADPTIPAADPAYPGYVRDEAGPVTPRDYLESAGEIDEIFEYGLELGGSLLEDRIWGWVAWAEREIALFAPRPVGYEGRHQTRTMLDNVAVKLNGRITSRNSTEGAYWRSEETGIGTGSGVARSPSAAWYRRPAGDRDNYRFEDSHVFSPSFYLSGRYSKVNRSFDLIPDSGEGCRTIECSDMSGAVARVDLSSGVWSETFSHHVSTQSQETIRADGRAFLDGGALVHEVSFGFGYREGIVSSRTGWPGDQFVISGPGVRDAVAMVRGSDSNFITSATDLYLGDTLLLGRTTIQLGLRYDLQKGTARRASADPNPLVPEVLPGLIYEPGPGGIVEWESLSPRLGVTYTMGDEHRLLLRAGYNRYTDQLGREPMRRSNALGEYQFALYQFEDANRNGRAEREELLFEGGPFGNGILDWSGMDPINTAAEGPFLRFDPDLDAPRTDEIIVGVEYEILPEFTAGLNFTSRNYSDTIWEVAEKLPGSGELYTSADYEPAGTLTQTLPGGETTTVTWYALRSGLLPPTYFVATNRPGYERSYEGVDLDLVKRLSNGWMARAYFSTSEWTQDVGPEGVVDPTPLRTGYGCSSCDGSVVVQGPDEGLDRTGGVYVTPGWAYGVAALYQIPFIDLDVSLSLFGREGYPLPYVHSVSSPEGRKDVLVDGVEADHLEDVFQLDLRFAKGVAVADGRVLTVSLEVFNLTDERTILQRETEIYRDGVQSARGARIRDFQDPRMLRAGLRLTF